LRRRTANPGRSLAQTPRPRSFAIDSFGTRSDLYDPPRTDGKQHETLCTVATTATVIAALASGAAAKERLQKLSAGQIRAKMAGMELTNGVHWRELYGAGRHHHERLDGTGKTVELRREGLRPLQGVIELGRK